MRKYRMSQKMPEKWFHIKLGGFLTEIRERNKSNNHNAESVLSVTNKSGFVISEEFFERKVFSKDLSNYKIVRRGQFAYNPSRVNVGSIARLKKIDSGLLSPMYFVFETKKGLDGTYLDHWISSRRFRNLVKANTQGTVRDSLNFSALAGFPFILPPLPEQRKIADILSSIDTLIEKTQVVINQTQTLKKALMRELFTRGIPGRHKKFKKTELGRIPEEWGVANISDVCIINPAKKEISKLSKNLRVSFMPMESVAEEGRGIVSRQERILKEVENGYTYFKEKDILFAKITPCMENGKVALTKNLINGIGFGSTEFHVLRVNANITIERFLYYWIIKKSFRNLAKTYFTGTAGQQRVQSDFFSIAKIPLPSRDEQIEIVDLLDTIDLFISQEEVAVNWLFNLKSALMQILLTGKVRVKV